MAERCVGAPGPQRAWSDAALVLCAHGIRGGPGSAVAHARAIERHGLFAEIYACAHKGRPGLIETLERVNSPTIYLLPLLMAEAYTLRAMLRKLETTPALYGRLRVCRPLGAHPRFAEVIARRAETTCAERGLNPADTALVIAGHGTLRDARSGATARAHAAAIERSGAFAEVAVTFLDEPPNIHETIPGLRSRHCVVVGLFVDRGEHGEEDIPELLAPFGAAYAGPVGLEPAVADLILDQIREADRLDHVREPELSARPTVRCA